jgi:chloride channel 7
MAPDGVPIMATHAADLGYADLRSSIKTHHFTHDEWERMKYIEGLDYTVVENDGWWQERAARKRWHVFFENLKYWLVVLTVGLVTGGVVFGVHYLSANALHYKYVLIATIQESSFNSLSVSPFLAFWLANVILGILACVSTIFLSPIGCGSGVPVSIGFLNGSRIPKAFNIKTLVARLLSTVFAGSVGLCTSIQDPLFHAAGIMGGGISEMKSRTLGCALPLLENFRNSRARRDFIAAGVAAGMSAAFGSPVAGLLFVMEQIAAFWNNRMIWRTFFGCSISGFAAAFLLSGADFYGFMFTKTDAVFERSVSAVEYRVIELGPFLAIGVLGGLFGAIFNTIHKRILLFRRDILLSWLPSAVTVPSRKSRWMCLFDVIVVFTLLSLLYFYMQLIVPCRTASASVSRDLDNLSPMDPIDWPPSPQRCHLSDSKGMNPLGMLLLGRPDNTLRHLFSTTYTASSSADPFDAKSGEASNTESFDDFFDVLWMFFLLYFVGTLLVAGAPISSGLLMPVTILGAAFGRQCGYWFAMSHHVHVYALVGASAMLAGVTRLPLTATVMMISIANDVQYLLPVMVAVSAGKWVGDLMNNSIFRSELGLMSVPYLYPEITLAMRKLTAHDVALKPAVVVPLRCRVRDIVDMLSSNDHNGFPVVELPAEGSPSSPLRRSSTSSSSSGFNSPSPVAMIGQPVVGMILRRTLLSILNHKVFLQQDQRLHVVAATPAQRKQRANAGTSPDGVSAHRRSIIVTVKEMQRMLRDKIITVHDLALSEAELDSLIDLGPFMNRAPVTVHESVSATMAFQLFLSLGLRHLPVVNGHNDCVGMITRKDLLEDVLQKRWRAKQALQENRRQANYSA